MTFEKKTTRVNVPLLLFQSLDLYKEIMYTIMHRLGARKQGGDNLTDGMGINYI